MFLYCKCGTKAAYVNGKKPKFCQECGNPFDGQFRERASTKIPSPSVSNQVSYSYESVAAPSLNDVVITRPQAGKISLKDGKISISADEFAGGQILDNNFDHIFNEKDED